MFPLASPSRTPSGKGLYFTVYPLSRPYTVTVCYIFNSRAVKITAVHGCVVQIWPVQGKVWYIGIQLLGYAYDSENRFFSFFSFFFFFLF